MRKAASWRGSATATSKDEFTRLLRNLKLSKMTDVFYDLGCGYGRPCVWIAPKVKHAVGFENHYDRYKKAKIAVARSGFKNIAIRRANFSYASYKNATIVYSMVDLGLQTMARVNRQSRPGTILIQYWRTNYPLKSKRIAGNYFIMKTPFKRVKDETEFARIFLGKKKEATIKDLEKELKREDRILLKEEIRDSESEWKRLFMS